MEDLLEKNTRLKLAIVQTLNLLWNLSNEPVISKESVLKIRDYLKEKSGYGGDAEAVFS